MQMKKLTENPSKFLYAYLKMARILVLKILDLHRTSIRTSNLEANNISYH